MAEVGPPDGAALEFLVPGSLDEAVGLLRGEEDMLLGGGTAVALLLRHRLITPARLIWLGRVPTLREISVDGEGNLRIGAGATLAQLARSPEVRSRCPSLARAAAGAANPRVRSVATIGGHIAHADPRQDLPPVLLAHGARLRLLGGTGWRDLDLADALLGLMETAVAPGEAIAEVVVPCPQGQRSTYARFTPGSEDDYPTVGVAVVLRTSPGGEVAAAKVAVGAAGPRAVVVEEAAACLVGRTPSEDDIRDAGRAVEEAVRPLDDQRGSAAYKRAMSGLWTRRALASLLGVGGDGLSGRASRPA